MVHGKIDSFGKIDPEYYYEILRLAEQYGFDLIEKKSYTSMVRFKRKTRKHGKVVISLFWDSKGIIKKIATQLVHPVHGKGQLYRHVSNLNELKKYFDNPRVHTNVGYGRSNRKKSIT